jgi:phage tail-like protein
VPPFSVNPTRFDPYKNFKFRVRWDGRVVAGVSKVSTLRRVTQVVEHRDGDDPSALRRSPSITRFDPIRLERGVTHDAAFEDWANLVWRLGAPAGSEVALAGFRKDVAIEMLNEAGQVAKAWRVHRAWPSEYAALPDLDANAPGVALETLVLQHEGWERDADVAEPAEPRGNATRK